METKKGLLKPWQRLHEKIVIDSKWLKVLDIVFILPNGKRLGNYFVAHKAPVAVLILVREDGKVYLVKQYERGVGEVGYKFPVTRVGEHEQPHEAAKRGLPEETGFSSKDMTYLGETYVDPGFMTTRAHFYLCMSLVAQKAAKKNSLLKPCIGEWMDFSELTKIILENRVKNPFVISGYMLAKVHLEKYYKNR